MNKKYFFNEKVFFESDDATFLKKNILLNAETINYFNAFKNEVEFVYGLRLDFLHNRNNFDADLLKLGDNKEYKNIKNDIDYILKNNVDISYTNYELMDYLKSLDASEFIKKYEKVTKIKRKKGSYFYKKYNEYKFFLGFDTEFKSNIQYNARLNEIEDLNIEKMHIKNCNDEIISYQFSLQISDDLFLTSIIFPYKTGYELTQEDTINRVLEFYMSSLFVDYRIYNDKLDATIIAHKNIVDFSKIDNFVSFDIEDSKKNIPERLKNLMLIRNCFVTAKPLLIGDWVNRHFKSIGNLHLRDSLLLDNPQSLRKMGDSQGFKKLEIGENIENMDIFKTNNINAYIMYALQDANIVVNFLNTLYKHKLEENEHVPLTIGGESARIAREFLKEEYSFSNDEFDKNFRGLDTYRSKRKMKQEYPLYLEPIFETFSKIYFGGRNQTFVHGYLKGNFYDIDGSKFYPVSASAIEFIDFNNFSYLDAGDVNENTFNMQKHEVGYALVDFEYTCNTKYIPNITVPTSQGYEDYGLLFPRKAENVIVTITELKSAYSLGCKIKIKTGVIFGTAEVEEDKKYPLEKLFKMLAEERNKYPKNSPENKFWKLVMNSITGKFGQGLKHKKVFSYTENDMEVIPQSRITSAPYIVEITSFGRTVITEVMNCFILENYKIINVVTDGFLVQSPNNISITNVDINNIINKYINDKRFPNLKIWVQALKRLNENNYLEIKHSGTEVLPIKTRVCALLNSENESLSQFSATGYILPPEWANYSLNKQIESFIKLVINRQERIKIKGKKLVTGKDIRNQKGTSAKMVDKLLSFNFDYKCKVVDAEEENGYILLKTTAWNTIDEFREEKRFRERNKDIQIINISGENKMELLERLRKYNFKKIDKKNEFNSIIEKFLIMVAKTKIFNLSGNTDFLNYDTVKGLLGIKHIEFSMNKTAYNKLKLQKSIKDNLENLKNTILQDLTDIFEDEKIRFYLSGVENNNLKYAPVLLNNKKKKVSKKVKDAVNKIILEKELDQVKFKN